MTPRSAKILPLLLLSALLPSGAALPDVDEWCSPENPEGCDAGQKAGADRREGQAAEAGRRTADYRQEGLLPVPRAVDGARRGPRPLLGPVRAEGLERPRVRELLRGRAGAHPRRGVDHVDGPLRDGLEPRQEGHKVGGGLRLARPRVGPRRTRGRRLPLRGRQAGGEGHGPPLAGFRLRLRDRLARQLAPVAGQRAAVHGPVRDSQAGREPQGGPGPGGGTPDEARRPTYGNDYYSTKKIKAGQEILLNYGSKWHAEMEKKKKKQDAEGEDGELDAEPTSAEMSKSDTVRSVDWLEENGMCLFDATITMSPTRLPEAARGAFVNRKVRQGEVLATSPVIVVRRDDLLVSNSEHSGRYQILLNYAFGHPDSSVLLVPMAPVVEYINHAPPSGSVASDGDKKKKKRKGDPATNAAVRWPEPGSAATRLYGEKESWLGMSADEVAEMSGRIAIEYVATADIEKGSEVYVDYGAGWDKSWRDFVRMHPYERAGYFRREMAAPEGMYPEGWLDLLVE
ncbi:hypothetical protein THAOC_24138 [Thalassiosira oceanica]|uniref:SET domain-containing protein n=1 Tax=Thalassiosira oceanica TaxID=159749 RepID=K0RUE8_THAOC|nr:hypothetical protein THAOC_24138 [Thalassiosira oceanica]|eukprot:EJK56044.1 hypothetical protein THAOC_24138 [Thalassiosira oceanica]